MSTQFVHEGQSRYCSSEPKRNQIIKMEPYYQDQDEELFSLADLARHIQPSSLTKSCNEYKHSVLLNRNNDLTSHSDLLAKRFINKKERQKTQTTVNPYCCDECEKLFRQLGKLVEHKRAHTGDKLYSCDQCTKSFSQSGGLVKHKRTHTAEKPYSCSHCNKSFRGSWSLDEHKRTHTGEKPYCCDQCNKSFNRS